VICRIGANKDHGLPRQEGTGKNIVLKMLADDTWSKMSQSEIARWVGVSHQFVNKIVASQKEVTCNRLQVKTASTTQKQGKIDGSDENLKSFASTEAEEKAFVSDAVGNNVPDNLRDVFTRQNDLKMMVHQIATIVSKLKEMKSKNDPRTYYINMASVEVESGNLKRSIKAGIPYSICLNCGGSGGNCRLCAVGEDAVGQGWINELRFRATPEELKKSSKA